MPFIAEDVQEKQDKSHLISLFVNYRTFLYSLPCTHLAFYGASINFLCDTGSICELPYKTKYWRGVNFWQLFDKIANSLSTNICQYLIRQNIFCTKIYSRQ